MGDTFEPYRGRRAQEREKRFSIAWTTFFVVVLTVVATAILAFASSRLSHDRSSVATFRAAPTCPSSLSSAAAVDADCKVVATYTVTFTSQQGSGSDWKAFIGLQSSADGQLHLQFAEPGNEIGFADDGDTVTLTSWHGVPIWVSNSTLTAELVNPLLESGNAPYTWLWYTAAVYVFLLPLAIMQRRARRLVIAPAVLLIVGLVLHGRVVGGDWLKCYLWTGLIVAVLYYIYAGVHTKLIRRLLRRERAD
jgi:hypothetical protein